MVLKLCKKGVAIISTFAALLAGGSVVADNYPSKAVRLIVPFAAGGSTDMVGRIVAQHLSERLGQPVVVENRAGAGGLIGVGAAAQSPADGYTLLLGTAEFGILGAVVDKVPFDAQRDFDPVALITRVPSVFAVNSKVSAQNLQEFIDMVRKRPGELNYGSPGIGTNIHLVGEMLKDRFGLDIRHVAYRGGALATTDLVAGRIEMMPSAVAVLAPRIKDGALRGLAVTSESRSPLLPDVPTMAEAGVPDFVVGGWFGILAPAGTPQPVIERLQKELVAIGELPEFKQRIVELGGEGSVLTGAEFGKFIAEESERWHNVVKSAKIELQY